MQLGKIKNKKKLQKNWPLVERLLILTRPDYVVFVDEVGSNTSQERDGALGGEKKLLDMD